MDRSVDTKNDEEVKEVDMTADELQAEALCEEINGELEDAEAKETLTEPMLEKALDRFKGALDLDPECVEAHVGIVYVCGLLGLFDEGLDEIRVMDELDLKDERIPEMKEKLLLMKKEFEEKGEEDDDDEPDETDEASIEKDEAPESGPTVEKLIIKGAIQPKFVAALTEIFQRFDKNNDKGLDDKELNAFHLVTNGTPIDLSTVRFLRQNFECDKNRALTLNGFINFYVSQALGDAQEAWKDLKNLGYDYDLNLVQK